jgi:hypothetical protein
MADPTAGQSIHDATQSAIDLDGLMEEIEASTKSIAETFKSIDLSNIKTFTQEINAATKEWVDNVKQISSEFRKELETLSLLSQDQQQLQIAGLLANQQKSVYSHYSKQEVENLEHELRLSESLFTSMQKRMEHWNQQLDSIAPKTRAAYKTMDEGARHLSTPAAVPGQLLNAMPGAGILSFLIMGMSANEKWRSMTEQAVQQFDRVGGGGKKFFGEMQGHIERLSNDLTGGAQTLVAINSAFAATGVSAKQAWGREGLTGDIGRVGRSLAEVSMKFDFLTEQAPGTTAHLIGTAYGQLGSSMESATSAIVTYGMAARSAGLDQVGFVNSVVQNAQALKLYGIQIDAVAAATLRVVDANKAAGMGSAYALEVGKAGIGQVTSGLAGITPGFAAVIGQQVAGALDAKGALSSNNEYNKWTANGSSFGIMMEMRQGFRNAPENERGGFMGESISAIYKQAMQAAGNSLPEAQFFLEKMGFGMEGSRTILQIGNDMKRDGRSQMTKEEQKTLDSATASEAQKTSSMDRSLQYLVTAVGQVAVGLLGMILSGIKIMIDILRISVSALTGESVTGPGGLLDSLRNDFKVMGRSGDFVNRGFSNLKTSGENFIDAVPFTDLWRRGINERESSGGPNATPFSTVTQKQLAVLKAQAKRDKEDIGQHLRNMSESDADAAGISLGQRWNYKELLGRQSNQDIAAEQNRDGTYTLKIVLKPKTGSAHANARTKKSP